MTLRRRFNPTTIGLWAVAVLLAANLLALLARGDSSSLLPEAFAQRQPPIAGGGGVFVMPAQLSPNAWGCYLLDIDAGTLCVYQFSAPEKHLRFVAARDFRYDRQMREYNTTPSPEEIRQLAEKARQPVRGVEPQPTTAPAQ